MTGNHGTQPTPTHTVAETRLMLAYSSTPLPAKLHKWKSTLFPLAAVWLSVTHTLLATNKKASPWGHLTFSQYEGYVFEIRKGHGSLRAQVIPSPIRDSKCGVTVDYILLNLMYDLPNTMDTGIWYINVSTTYIVSQYDRHIGYYDIRTSHKVQKDSKTDSRLYILPISPCHI